MNREQKAEKAKEKTGEDLLEIYTSLCMKWARSAHLITDDEWEWYYAFKNELLRRLKKKGENS
jgi:hypothetical protein